jgi:hypothetical protein
VHREPRQIDHARVFDLGIIDRVAGEDVVFDREEPPERIELNVGILERAIAEEELIGGGHGIRVPLGIG